MTLAQETYQWSFLQTDTYSIDSDVSCWFSGYVGVTDPINCYLILDVKPRNGTNRFPNNGAASNQTVKHGPYLKTHGRSDEKKNPQPLPMCANLPTISEAAPPRMCIEIPCLRQRGHCGHATYPSSKAQQLKQIGKIPKGILMTAASFGTDAGTRLRSFFACTT